MYSKTIDNTPMLKLNKITKGLTPTILDEIIQVDDISSFLMARKLLKEEGVFVGGFSGVAVYGTVKVAEKIILTILPDTGHNYLGKFFQDKWM